MAKRKFTLFLLLIFFALVAIYAGQKLFASYQKQKLLGSKTLVSIKNPEDINTIEVMGPNYNFVIKKTAPGTWMIGPYEAVPSFIEQMLDAVRNTRILAYVSSTLENADKFQLSEKTSVNFVLKKDGIILDEFRAAVKPERTGDGFYVIRKGEKKIALSEDLGGSLFYEELRSALAEKTAREKISRVVITRGKEKIEIKKENDAWLVNGRKARSEKIDDFLNYVSKIVADGFPEAERDIAYDTKIEITADGKTSAVEIGKKPEDTLYTLKNSQGVVYLITEKTYGNLAHDAKFFWSAK